MKCEGRNTGSPEILIAAGYLAKQLESYGTKQVPGADGWFQSVPLRMKSPATTGSFSYGGKSFNLNEDFLVVEGKSGAFNGEVAYLEYGMAPDYEGKDISEKFVFVKSGDGKSTDRRSILRLSTEVCLSSS